MATSYHQVEGGDVRLCTSPLDCLKIARANPAKQVVFFAIGLRHRSGQCHAGVARAREN